MRRGAARCGAADRSLSQILGSKQVFASRAEKSLVRRTEPDRPFCAGPRLSRVLRHRAEKPDVRSSRPSRNAAMCGPATAVIAQCLARCNRANRQTQRRVADPQGACRQLFRGRRSAVRSLHAGHLLRLKARASIPVMPVAHLVRKKRGLRRSRNPLNRGAGNGIRTRDPQLGKLMLYQLSYSRKWGLIT